MNSPAERYARSRNRRKREEDEVLNSFISRLNFEPDDFQLLAFQAISTNKSVLVAAPTGSGKTLVAEFGIVKALSQQQRIFYTTPIKALSNQKYRDFCDLYGDENVGLLTGDRKVNSTAPILVMTTEILRNMIYDDLDRLTDLGWIVMDEVHYLADKSRGSVWEEILILLSPRTRVIALSATVSNAEEFGAWLSLIRGDFEVIVSEKRPIPLDIMVFQNNEITDLFTDKDKSRNINSIVTTQYNRKPKKARNPRFRKMTDSDRSRLIRRLSESGGLPAIYFIFSRAGCDAAATSLISESHGFLNKEERIKVRDFVEAQLVSMSDSDLQAIDISGFMEKLDKGVATHHAGMIPIFKEIVEQLFQANLTKIVFATETLSLGVNMPARSVVIESLRKFDGQKHVDLSPGEFTQLTGRAGRRGMDDYGYAIVPLSDAVSPLSVSSLASARTFPLKSNFQPNYNMSLNLVRNYGISSGLALIEKSFAQFQTNKKLINQRNRFSEIKIEIDSLPKNTSEKEFSLAIDYMKAVDRLEELRKSLMNQTFRSYSTMGGAEFRPGTVIRIDDSEEEFIVTNLDMSKSLLSVVSLKHGLQKMNWHEFSKWPKSTGFCRIPRGFNPNNKDSIIDLFKCISRKPSLVPIAEVQDSDISAMQNYVDNHEFHRIGERSSVSKQARKYLQLREDLEKLEEMISKKSGNLGQKFLSIYKVLLELDYLSKDDEPTAKGELLSNLYLENDLLLTESIDQGMLSNLSIAEFGAVLSAFVFEGRHHSEMAQVTVPTRRIGEALNLIDQLNESISVVEKSHGLALTRGIDASFANAVHDWIVKENLLLILNESDLAPGDFVRWIKQLTDLSNQLINSNAPAYIVEMSRSLREAISYGIVRDLDMQLVDF